MMKKLWRDEEGPTAVEYALMVAGIAVAVIVTVKALGGQVSQTFADVTTAITPAAAPAP